MLDARHIVHLQAEATTRWHDPSTTEPTPLSSWDTLILDQHRANFDLWHEEDAARDPFSSDHDITEHKHSIDKLNQRRNDLAERCDIVLLEQLHPLNLPRPEAELNSESPGLIIDRLSILALKIFHTAEEIQRVHAPEGHAERNSERLQILKDQRTDLAAALDRLWQQTLAGERGFKLYRQLKMYNDPALNPAVYKSRI